MARLSNWTKKSSSAVGSKQVSLSPSYSPLSKEGMIIINDLEESNGWRRCVLKLSQDEMIKLRDRLNSMKSLDKQ